MSNMKCGYCRVVGHRRPVCPLLHAQRREIYTNTVNQRKELYSLACKRGFGNGAIVRYTEWGTTHVGTVMDLEECIPLWQFYTYNRVKYTKQTRPTYNSIADAPYLQHIFKVLLDGGMEHAHATTARIMGDTSYGNRWEALSPSYDEYEVGDSVWSSRICISRRIGLGDELVERWGDIYLNPQYNL